MNTALIRYAAGIALCIAIYWKLPGTVRKPFLTATGLFLLALVNPLYATVALLASALIFYTGRKLEPEKDATPLFAAAIILLTACLIALKLHFGKVSLLNHEFSGSAMAFPAGASYFYFRAVHYLSDIRRGLLKPGSLPDFISYLFFFPTFLAGPVERYQKFNSQTAVDTKFEFSILNYGALRISQGLIKKAFLADTLSAICLPLLSSPELHSGAILFLAVMALPAIVFFDFSGYSDIAIGLSSCFGYRIMENFDRPYLASNPADFVRRWHISFYTWLRDYIFFPIAGRHPGNLYLYLGILGTLLASALWHSFTAAFAAGAFYYTFLILAWFTLQNIKRQSPLIRRFWPGPRLSILLNLFFIAFGLLLLYTDTNQSIKILKLICCFYD